jgi:hypothetical protein
MAQANSQTVHEAILALRADSAQLRSDLARGRSIMEGGLRDFQATMTRFAGLLGLSLGGAGIISFFRSSFAELEKQESAQASLEATLRSTGQESQRYMSYLLQQATALQRVTTFGDDAIISVQQQLIAFGASGQEIQRLTELTLDLASGMRIDVTSAARLMGRALAGEFGSFSRYGIIVDESATKTEKLNQVLRQIEERFGGQAQAQAETMTGEIKQLSNAWGELQEAIAGVIAQSPLIEKVLRGMTALLLEQAQRLQGASQEALKSTVKNLTEIAARVSGLEPGRIALMSDEDLRKFAEQSRTAKGEITSLLEARRRLNEFLQTLPPVAGDTEDLPTGKPRTLIDPDQIKKSDDKVRSFFDSLQKQLEQTQSKIKEGLFGEGAGIGDQLDAEFKRLTAALSAAKLPVPKGLQASFDVLKQAIIGANAELRTQKLLLEQTGAGLDALDAEEGKSREESIEKERELNREIAERIRLLEIEQAFSGFDLIDAEQGRQIEDQTNRVRDLGRTLSDLRDDQYDAEQLSKALGLSFELTSEKISIQRARIEALTEAYGALSPEVREAVDELRRLEDQQEAFEVFNRLFDSFDRGIQDTVRGIAEGSQTLEEGMRNLARNMVLSFQEELLRLTVINPIKNWLMDMLEIEGPRAPTLDLGNLLGLTGGTAGPGGAPNISPLAAAPAAMALPVDFEGWTFEIVEGFSMVDQSMNQGLQGLFGSTSAGFTEFFGNLGTSLMDGLGSLTEGLGSLVSGLFSGISSGIGGFFNFLGFEKGGLVPAFETGGLVHSLPRFDDGGLAVVHPGEFVLKAPSVRSLGLGNVAAMNESGRPPGSDTGGMKLEVDFQNAQIIPRAPWVTAKDVAKISVKSIKDQSELYEGIRRYGPPR